MEGFLLTKHADEMIRERGIELRWLEDVLHKPEWMNVGVDGNLHYFKHIPDYGDRVLHVVINNTNAPKNIVTVFFDRRARREL